MKILVPNYSCLQNPWRRGLPPPDPRSLCPQLNLLNPPSAQNSWVRHWLMVPIRAQHFIYFIGRPWGGKTKDVPCHAFLVVLVSVCTLAAYDVTSMFLNHRGLKYCINSLPVLFVHNFVIMSLLFHLHTRDMHFSWYFNSMARKLDYCTWDMFYMFGGVFCLWKKSCGKDGSLMWCWHVTDDEDAWKRQ